MRKLAFAVLIPLSLSGCLSFSSSSPLKETVYVPVQPVCANGFRPPC